MPASVAMRINPAIRLVEEAMERRRAAFAAMTVAEHCGTPDERTALVSLALAVLRSYHDVERLCGRRATRLSRIDDAPAREAVMPSSRG
jgi:hypothetical protein